MKKSLLIVAVVAVGAIAWYGLTRNSNLPSPAEALASAPAGLASAAAQAEPAPAHKPAPAVVPRARANVLEEANPPAPVALPNSAAAGTAPLVDAAVATLVTPTATYQEKQAAFGKLRDSGKLDLAITELERRVAADPKTPEYPATLGQAYLQKAGTLKDIREQGILGMKADQTFEAALQIDPTNWEASYWKATAMSYWPDMLNKTRETAQQFIDTIHIQESSPPQPEYARTYLQLGDYYKARGYADYATQIWQRGLTQFPNHGELTERLAQ